MQNDNSRGMTQHNEDMFLPIGSLIDCKDGVCPVPWATAKEEAPIIKEDLVNHPTHYQDGGIECIEAIEAQLSVEEYRGFLRGNCAKYLWRCNLKGDAKENLLKCEWYLRRLIETY